jgi:hypothetical protein
MLDARADRILPGRSARTATLRVECSKARNSSFPPTVDTNLLVARVTPSTSRYVSDCDSLRRRHQGVFNRDALKIWQNSLAHHLPPRSGPKRMQIRQIDLDVRSRWIACGGLWFDVLRLIRAGQRTHGALSGGRAE